MNKNTRLTPKISFINYRKEFKNISNNCFSKLFSISKYWKGRIVNVEVKHYCLSFDFRKNWLLDMVKL